jgi:hypothetical protein
VAAVSSVAVVDGRVVSASAAATVSGNRLRAQRDARVLLAGVVLPPGAVRLTAAPAAAAVIANRFPGLASPALADVYGYWHAPGPPGMVLAYIGAHTPHLARAASGGGGSRRSGLSWSFLDLEVAPVPGVLDARWLVVKVVGLPGGATAVRVDAEVVWVIPRSASERIPAAVRELDVTRGRPGQPPVVSVTVTNPATIARIVSLINSLPTVQPYPLHCPSWPADAPLVTLTFRAARGGPVVAQPSELADATEPTTGCDPMNLTLFGKPQTPLLDGAAAIRTVQQLLGVKHALAP